MIFWSIFLGLPLLLFGVFSLASREKLMRFVRWFESSRYVALILTAVAWVWATYEIMTFGCNMFGEFFVGVPILGHLMTLLGFLYDHFWAVTPILIYLTFIWMPKSLSMRAFTGILMLIPAELLKTTRFLLPDNGFIPIQFFILVAYIGAIIGMYGMFYPWNLEKGLDIIISKVWATKVMGFICALSGAALLLIGLTV